MRKRYLTTYLLAMAYVVAELHTFWHNDQTVQNWILRSFHPMKVNWNIYFASQQAMSILISFAMLTYGLTISRNRVNKVSVQTFIVWCIIDTLLYFYNFKEEKYAHTYFWLAAIWLFLFYGKRITAYIWGVLHPHEKGT